MSQQLKDSLTEAKAVIEAQDEELKRIANTALISGVILEVSGKYAYVTAAGKSGVSRVSMPPKMKLQKGDSVLLFSETGQIVEKQDATVALGAIITVRNAWDGKAEVENNGTSTYVATAIAVKKGDRVILDPTGSAIIEKLEEEDMQYAPTAVPNVKWEDIGGLEEAKAHMIEAVELPHKNKEIFEFYGKRPTRGILLYGPPGCGKTMLGKATAKALADIYQSAGGADSFMYIKGPEILNKYVGESESAVRSIFARAKAHKDAHGYPAVVFIDEADSILAKRGMRRDEGGNGMSGTIVPMFLTEMDGLEESAALVILATNRPDVLDPAIVRDGRIDRKIKVTRPNYDNAVEILKLNIERSPFKGKAEDLAQAVATAIYASERVLYNIKTVDGVRPMTLAQFVNGGMLAGVIDYGLSLAIQRDIASGKKSGLTKEDLISAVEQIDRQSRDLDHMDEIRAYAELLQREVKGVSKVPYASPHAIAA